MRTKQSHGAVQCVEVRPGVASNVNIRKCLRCVRVASPERLNTAPASNPLQSTNSIAVPSFAILVRWQRVSAGPSFPSSRLHAILSP